MARCFIQRGGRLVTSAMLTTLEQDETGWVCGGRGWLGDAPLRVRSRSLILATGGFAGNSELLTRYVGRWADRMIVRANPINTGDGLLAAMAIGAAPSRGLHSFYGHHQPAPPARVGPHNYRDVTPYFSEHTVIVNVRGRRYADESLGDELTAQETVRQPEPACVLLFDKVVCEQYARAAFYPGGPALDRLEAIRRAGGEVIQAQSLPHLVAAVTVWGVRAPSLALTLETYNAAIRDGQAERLEVPRRANHHGLVTPPFYALKMVPGVTYTLGGLQIDQAARVLDTRGHPIGGLYAAGADAGGIFCDRWAGGLAMALVFGRAAGAAAAV
jgi:succinate dehydrogenase/fumarate reductase flavoprotein subunit